MSRKVLNDSDQEALWKEFTVDSKLGHHFQEEYHYRVSRLEPILKGDGEINHPWGTHTPLEEPAHLIRKLEEFFCTPNSNQILHRAQVFEDIEKIFLKRVADQMENADLETVKVVDLEAIAAGPHKDYLEHSLSEMLSPQARFNSRIISNFVSLRIRQVAS